MEEDLSIVLISIGLYIIVQTIFNFYIEKKVKVLEEKQNAEKK